MAIGASEEGPGYDERKGMTMSLKSRLVRPPILLAPGVYDPLTASLATDAGAEAIYLSGASIAYTRLGRPDIGLVSMTEIAPVRRLDARSFRS